MKRRHDDHNEYRPGRQRRSQLFEALVTPPDAFGPSQTRVMRMAQRLRLGIAAAFVVVVPVLPGASLFTKLVVEILVVGYVAASWYVETSAPESSWMSARVVNPGLGILMVFAPGLLVPEWFAAGLFIYLLGLVFYTLTGGLGLGLWISGAAIPAAVISNSVITAEYQVDPLTLAFFALTMVGSAFLCDLVTRERRRSAAGLDRLHEALRSVSASPNLGATLASVVDVIDDSMGAIATGVLLREDDHLVLASPPAAGWPSDWTPERVVAYTRREL